MSDKQWYSITRGANGQVSVKCSMQEDNLSVSWAVKTYATQIKEGVQEASKGARKALADLKAARTEVGS